MIEENEGHSVDEDGYCRYSDLKPEFCSGHWGRPPEERRRSTTWGDLEYSQNRNSAHSRERNHASLGGAVNRGEPWTPEQDRELESWGGTLEEAAAHFGRTCEGVHMRQVRLRHGKDYH